MSWLKLDEHITENLKVQKLSPEIFKFWINVLCVAKATEGDLSDLDRVSFRLRIPKTRVVVNLERLRTARLVDLVDGAYRMHDWEDWQFKDYTAKDRMRRMRSRNDSVTGSVTPPVTDGVTVDVTKSVTNSSVLFCSDLSFEVKTEENFLTEPSTNAPPFDTIDEKRVWFDEFWQVYWLKAAKKDAHRAFDKQVKSYQQFEEIMRAMKLQIPRMMERQPEHRPHAATWINGHRWEDEIAPAAVPKKSPRELLLEGDTENA